MAIAYLPRDDILQCRIYYELTQDSSANTSTIKPTDIEILSDDALGSFWAMGSLRVGTEVVWADYSRSASANLNTWWSGLSGVLESGSTVTVAHDGNGNGSVTFSITLSFESDSYGDYGYQGQVTIQLPPIPRRTGIQLQGNTLGSPIAIRLSPAVSGFSTAIAWRCGNQNGWAIGWTTGTSATWTPPLSLASQFPTSIQVPITLSIFTNNTEGTLVSAYEENLVCVLPDSVVPTVSGSLADKMGYLATFGGYVQNKSQLRVTSTAAGVYGSTVQSITVSVGGQTGTGNDLSFSLPDAGTVAVTVTATDSRGRKGRYTANIRVLAYSTPRLSIQSLARCDASGNAQAGGSYAKALIQATVPAMSNKNTTRYTLQWRRVGTTAWTSKAVPDSDNRYSLTNAPCLFSAGIDERYECRAVVTDAFGTTESLVLTLSVAYALMDFNRATKAVGIGQRANTANTLGIGMNVKMFGNRVTDLGNGTDGTDAATLEQAMRGGNLLDNGDFLINQRGITSVTRTASGDAVQYIRDRWPTGGIGRAGDWGNTFAIFATAANASFEVKQFIPEARTKFWAGKQMTFSILCEYASPVKVTFTVPENKPSTTGELARAAIGDASRGHLIVTYSPAGTIALYIRAYTTGGIGLKRARLELGPVSTLGLAKPNTPGDDLIECMRYFQRLKILIGTPVGSAKRLYVQMPVTMRAAPAATVNLNTGVKPTVTVRDAMCIDVDAGSNWADITVDLSADA